jgi:hypothetical protein
MTNKTFREALEFQEACEEGMNWVRYQTPQSAWRNCSQIFWALWWMKHSVEYEREGRIVSALVRAFQMDWRFKFKFAFSTKFREDTILRFIKNVIQKAPNLKVIVE